MSGTTTCIDIILAIILHSLGAFFKFDCQGEFLMASLTIRSKVGLCNTILTQLTPRAQELFRLTPFGHWLDVQMSGGDALLVSMFLQLQVTQMGADLEQLHFEIGGHIRRYGREEFMLITGLPFGILPELRSAYGDALIRRLFPSTVLSGKRGQPFRVKIKDVSSLFDRISRLSDEV